MMEADTTIVNVVSSKFTCLDCDIPFIFSNDLRYHLSQIHNVEIRNEDLNFQSFDDFNFWLSELERRENVQYCKHRGAKVKDNIERHYFDCARSARHFSFEETKKKCKTKRYRSKELKKSSIACTSQIILKRNAQTDECSGVYYTNHYGHSTDVQHLRLTHADKDDIASKLMSGLPPNSIIQSIQEKIDENTKRIDTVTRADIRYIKKSYGLDLEDGCRTKKQKARLLQIARKKEIEEKLARKKENDKIKEDVKEKLNFLLWGMEREEIPTETLKFMDDNLTSLLRAFCGDDDINEPVSNNVTQQSIPYSSDENKKVILENPKTSLPLTSSIERRVVHEVVGSDDHQYI